MSAATHFMTATKVQTAQDKALIQKRMVDWADFLAVKNEPAAAASPESFLTPTPAPAPVPPAPRPAETAAAAAPPFKASTALDPAPGLPTNVLPICVTRPSLARSADFGPGMTADAAPREEVRRPPKPNDPASKEKSDKRKT
jgi:hypothetical protein